MKNILIILALALAGVVGEALAEQQTEDVIDYFGGYVSAMRDIGIAADNGKIPDNNDAKRAMLFCSGVMLGNAVGVVEATDKAQDIPRDVFLQNALKHFEVCLRDVISSYP